MRLYQAAPMGAPGVARSKSLQVNIDLGAGGLGARVAAGGESRPVFARGAILPFGDARKSGKV